MWKGYSFQQMVMEQLDVECKGMNRDTALSLLQKYTQNHQIKCKMKKTIRFLADKIRYNVNNTRS